MKHKAQAISILTRTRHLSPPWASLRQFTHIHHILMLCHRRLDLQGVSFLQVFLWEIFVYFSCFPFVPRSRPAHVPLCSQSTCTAQRSTCHEAPCYAVLPILLLLCHFKHWCGVTIRRRRKWRPPIIMEVFRTALVPAWDHRRKTDSHPCAFWGWSFSFVSWPIQVTSPTTFWTRS